MSGFDIAKQFFEACETGLGWAGCQSFVAADASFAAQNQPIADIASVEGYTEWMKQMGNETLRGASYTCIPVPGMKQIDVLCFLRPFMRPMWEKVVRCLPPINRPIQTMYTL